MQTIVKFICLFVSLFVIVNGLGVYYLPPSGDELAGVVIVAVGIIAVILTLFVALHDARFVTNRD